MAHRVRYAARCYLGRAGWHLSRYAYGTGWPSRRKMEQVVTLDDLNLSRRLTYRTSQKPWTAAEVNRLRYLWNDLGLTAGEIATIMGRTRGGITGAARRHGLDRRDCPIAKVWKPDMIKQREVELGRKAAIEQLLRMK